MLLLRDVLQWKSAEVAEAIGTTTVAVNSLLQRARSQMETVRPSAEDRLSAPDSLQAQDLLARYIAAFETYDIDRLVELFTAEAIWEMPPYVGWYQGARDIITLIHQQCPAESPGDMRMIPLVANGQPAAAMYLRAGQRAGAVPVACAGHGRWPGVARGGFPRRLTVPEVRSAQFAVTTGLLLFGRLRHRLTASR